LLRALDEDLWVAERPYSLLGVRTTVVRLSDGGLFVHCPIALGDGLQAELAALGPVRHLVAANKLHYFFLSENLAAFPGAELHLAPGLAEKRPKLPPGQLPGEGSPPWQADLDQRFVAGWPFLNETLFCHRKSRTLLITDIAFNTRTVPSAPKRLLLRMLRAYGQFGPSLIARLSIKDRAALRRSIEAVLAWDFERITVTHGDVVEKHGRAVLREAYAFL
jgi:hypothetical protein